MAVLAVFGAKSSLTSFLSSREFVTLVPDFKMRMFMIA